jgi:Tfp pilus assembly protein PilF
MKRSDHPFCGRKLILPGVLLLALALRIIFLLQINTTPLVDFLAADTGDFERFSLEILKGNLLSRETIYFNPLYPFFLAAVYFILGHHPLMVMIIQALVDTGTCLLIYLISTNIFRDRVTGLIAAFFYAGYGLAIFYTGIMVGASLATFLFIFSAYLLLAAARNRYRWLWFLIGITYGLAVLLRPNTLFVFPFIIFWIIRGRADRVKITGKLCRVAVVIAGILLVILPFSVRNYLITGNISPPFGNGGFNFYVGNHQGASGTYTYLKGISNSPAGQIKSSVLQAKKAAGEEVSLSQASAYWFDRGIRFVVQSPSEYLLLLGRKFLLFWNAQEIGQNIDYYFSKRFSSLLALPLFSFGIVAPFAWLGFIFALRRRPAGILIPVIFLFAYLGSIIVFFVSARYRLPAIPFIIIFSSYGVSSLIRLFFPKIKKSVWLYIIFLIAVFIPVNINLSPVDETEYLSWSHNMLGNVYQEKGMPAKAIREFHRALTLDPDNISARNFLGSAYRSLGQLDRAIHEYKQALLINPEDATARNNLGVAYAELEMVEEAFVEFQAALKANPDFGEAHSNLAVYYFYYGENIRLARYHAGLAVYNGYQIPDRLREDLGTGR